jgi:ribose transport system substrate-binding protein
LVGDVERSAGSGMVGCVRPPVKSNGSAQPAGAEDLAAGVEGGGCLQLGNVAADNINARAAGTRDTLAGAKGIKRLTGRNGWKEIDGCPVFTKLDAFVLEGGWAQFAPQAYSQVTGQVMEKLKSKALVIVAGDTLPPQIEALKAGRSHVQVGQRPFEMGYRAPSVMIDLINGKKVAPVIYTGLDECTQENVGKCIAK